MEGMNLIFPISIVPPHTHFLHKSYHIKFVLSHFFFKSSLQIPSFPLNFTHSISFHSPHPNTYKELEITVCRIIHQVKIFFGMTGEDKFIEYVIEIGKERWAMGEVI